MIKIRGLGRKFPPYSKYKKTKRKKQQYFYLILETGVIEEICENREKVRNCLSRKREKNILRHWNEKQEEKRAQWGIYTSC
jgi:hypothetical protein